MKWLWGLLLLGVLLPGTVLAQEPPEREFGVRGGVDACGTDENFTAFEAYLQQPLPWRAETGAGLLLTRLDLGVGYLEAGSDQGGWLAAGGDVVWVLANGQVELEAGLRPTLLSDHRFGADDLGGTLQFFSHAGVALRLSRLVISYRFQHVSNAGIYHDNAGINLYLFGVGATF